MASEIERRYLVVSDAWRNGETTSSRLRQGYLATSHTAVVRVRIIDSSQAMITIKSRKRGATRSEFEYDVPLQDAMELMAMCGDRIIEKQRFAVRAGEHDWVVDVFAGRHAGLVLAELELEGAGQEFPRPAWVGREVTDEPAYGNETLAESGPPERGEG